MALVLRYIGLGGGSARGSAWHSQARMASHHQPWLGTGVSEGLGEQGKRLRKQPAARLHVGRRRRGALAAGWARPLYSLVALWSPALTVSCIRDITSSCPAPAKGTGLSHFHPWMRKVSPSWAVLGAVWQPCLLERERDTGLSLRCML